MPNGGPIFFNSSFHSEPSGCLQAISCEPWCGPGNRPTLVLAKVGKAMLAVAWPFGSPARFADSFGLAQDRSGGAQTRCAQTMRALSPVPAALLGHTTRPVGVGGLGSDGGVGQAGKAKDI